MDVQGSPEGFFAGSPEGMQLYRGVEEALRGVGDVTVVVTKSQIAFKRRRSFAYVWRPGQYVKSDVPAVLSFALKVEVSSPRFKSVVHPSAKVWMHHLELRRVDEIDEQVRDWLRQAYEHAG